MQLNQLCRNYLVSGISNSPDFACAYRIRHCQLQMADCNLHCEVSCNSAPNVACGGKLGGWNNLNIIYGPLWGRK